MFKAQFHRLLNSQRTEIKLLWNLIEVICVKIQVFQQIFSLLCGGCELLENVM